MQLKILTSFYFCSEHLSKGHIKKIKPFYKSQIVVSTTKGFEVSGKRMSQIIEEELQTVKVAVLSGPNHAEEVSMKMPTASIVACKNLKTGKIICDVLQTQYFKLYELDDVIGTEICAALKILQRLQQAHATDLIWR